MKYSSPSIVILPLNSKRIRCFFSRSFFQELRQMIQQFFLSQFMEGVGGGGGNKGGGGTILQNGKTKRSMGDPIKRENQSSSAFSRALKRWNYKSKLVAIQDLNAVSIMSISSKNISVLYLSISIAQSRNFFVLSKKKQNCGKLVVYLFVFVCCVWFYNLRGGRKRFQFFNIFCFIKNQWVNFRTVLFFSFQYENLLLKLSMLFKKQTNYKAVLKALPTTVFD